MHKIQLALLRLADNQDLSRTTLKQTALDMGMPELSPSKLQYHFEKLESLGELYVDRKRQTQIVKNELHDANLVSIPIVGSANCGPAAIFAVESPEGYLRLSKKIIKSGEGLIAVRAKGNSMNNSQIATPAPGVKAAINDGDIVVVNTDDRSMNNKYVLSIIDGMANIKKLVNRQYDIALVSESKDQNANPPIIITPEDNYMIGGKVVMVCQP